MQGTSRKKYNGRYFKVLLFEFTILIAIFAIILSSVYFYINHKLKQDIIRVYTESVDEMSLKLNNILQEIYNSGIILMSNRDVEVIMSQQSQYQSSDYIAIQNVIELLLYHRLTSRYIHNSYIYDESNQMIFSGSGSHDAINYFGTEHVYDDDSFSINDVDSLLVDNMALLGVMELIYGSGNVKPIIPVIQKPLNHLGKSNTFVVELDLYEILEDLVRNDVTEHSSTYLIDYDKGIMYSSNGMEAFMTDSEKITLLKNENNLDVKEYKFKNGRLFAKNIDFLQEDNKIIALYISDSDLYTNIFGMRVILISAIIYSIILLLVLGGLLTLKAYKPINLLMNGVSSKVELKNYSGKNNEMQYINNAFTELVSINEHLKDDLSIVMPIACEKYLLLMLKSNDSNYINLEDKLRQYGVIFPHSNFCVVDIEVKFTKKYVDKFTSNERMIQIDRIFKLIKDINFKNSVSYIVSESNHKLYYIMNTADTKLLKEIESTFECFLNAVKNNGEYIKLNIGIGTIHKHLIGIRSSFNEAQCAGRLLDDLLDQSLMVYSEKRQDNTYLYTMMDENSIYNNLNLGNYEEAISIMKTIVLKNNERNTSEAGIRQLYMSFYRIAERIIYERQKKVNDILNEVDVILESELKSMNNAEIINYVMLLYDSIVKFFFSRKSQTNINEIIEYIKDNMSNDVCLDKIASHFGLTPKYISKLFKDKLEISYSHYFNVLRIEEAKRQLVNTDSTIENIYKNMCYNSRSSFIRMFKKFEGITPSEFRSYHKVKI